MKRYYPAVFALLAVLLLSLGCSREGPPPAETITVNVAQPIPREVTDFLDFTGRTDAVDLIEVKARVRGYLDKVSFKDGELVEKGKVLYQIDPRPYQAKLLEAQGNLETAQGQKQLADIQVERYGKLAVKGATSKQDLDEWKAKQVEAAGQVKSAQGKLDDARLNLEFCTIKSPIAGQIGRTMYVMGDLITEDVDTLTTIASINPIYAYFNVEEQAYLRVIRAIRAGKVKTDEAGRVPVSMSLADDGDKTYPLHGKLNFVNNQVDKLTATINVRGVFENPFDPTSKQPPLLKPGLFVRTRVPTGPPQPALLVNERAIATDQAYKYVYVVDAKNQVQYRRIQLGPSEGEGLQVITSGLQPGDWVIVSGLQRCRPGMEVKTEQVNMKTLKPAESKP